MPTNTAADIESVAVKCLRAWTSGDLETTRSLLHNDVTFVGPLAATNGLDDYMTGIKGMGQIVSGVDIDKVFADGDEVCIFYRLGTKVTADKIRTAGRYRVRDGKISSVEAIFDPRPLLSGNSS